MLDYSKGDMMDKKGAELSFNVIVVAILVILVLVIVAYFFIGGVTKLVNQIFGVGPDDISTASSSCSSKCLLAQSLDTTSKKSSEYCRKTWKFDVDGDGQIDKDAEGNIRKYHCYESPISQDCASVRDYCPETA